MKHRAFSILVVAALACAALAATASAAGKGRAFQFRGELTAASSSSVSLQVEGGNHAALRAMLGQSQDQSFAVTGSTEVLIWSHGIPKVGTVADLKLGDWVQLTLHDKGGSSLSDLETKGAGVVADRATKGNPSTLPLYLYVGQVAGPQANGQIAMNVSGGDARALRTMIGQPSAQTFTYGDSTIFLLWQGKVPTVIDASQLKAGDRITVRVRAPRASTLAQVEATAAVHVGDHEPANASDNS
ncbi:MAG TPA: hypothetical protein VHV52_07915 [Gaiellaceae bacterium]|jgi:hypothetical protein|nr:hypothetical protein [Gaiellaceae bacterium]